MCAWNTVAKETSSIFKLPASPACEIGVKLRARSWAKAHVNRTELSVVPMGRSWQAGLMLLIEQACAH